MATKTRPVKPRLVREILIAVEPWSAGGPGWANSGATAHIEQLFFDGSIRWRTEVLYSRDMTAEQELARSICVRALRPLIRWGEKMVVSAGGG